jgi:formylglycine-generating enzyme required for sulfatase activity
LPRVWKIEPEDDPEVEPPAQKSKAKADDSAAPVQPTKRKKRQKDDKSDAKSSKPRNGKGDGEKKGVLVEETPNLDTQETRQRIRIAIGVAAVAGISLFVWLFVHMFMPPAPREDAVPHEMVAAVAPEGHSPARDDQESKVLFSRARDVAKNGNVELSVELLKRVMAKYPTTRAASDAREALDRPHQNLPMFLDRPTVVASQTAPAPLPPDVNPPAQVVDATRTPVALPSGSQANLAPPVNPAEPPTTPAQEVPPAAEKPSKPLPKGFHPRQGAEIHTTGWPLEIVGDRDGAPMVLVIGGTFIQGRDDADPSEAPAHKVVLGSFYIDKHEVTVRQFNLFQKESGKRAERVRALTRDPALTSADSEDDRPVVLVTAREASDYCYWAGKRLPTEAQWEASARTPDGRLYPSGPEPPTWARPRAPRQIDAVMSFPNDLSPYGAFDLAGNAWEWTKDWYDPRYYQLFRATNADNPTGPASRPRSPQLVVKGSAKDWVVTRREGIKPDARLPYLGFRGVLQVEGPGNAFDPTPSAAQPTPSGPPAGSSVPF